MQKLLQTMTAKAVLFGALAFGLAAPAFAGVQLVTDETLKIERALTSTTKLSNGIPVIIRQIPDSDILHVNVVFRSGLKDLPPGRKVLNQWMWAVMPTAAEGYPKAKVFGISEKYGFDIGCGGGIEYSECGLDTLNDYWKEALPLYAALITKPSFTEEDAKLTRDRLSATLRNTPSDPGEYINEIINDIFYPVGHPYRLNSDEALKELDGLSRKDLVAMHKDVLNSGNLFIVAVTSLPQKQLVADLEKAFGGIAAGDTKHVDPQPPVFDEAKSYAFNDRDLPTAYIRIKLNAVSALDKDAIPAHLMFEILSEELSDEVRTRRSLSYAVHSFLIQYHLGIGVISASTSKPKETLEAINDVIQAIKNRNYTDEELEEFKHAFATSYYLTQETHASLASALGDAYFFHNDANEMYDLPRKLDKVTPADIKRMAEQVMVNLRVGVIYGRSEFQDEWAQTLIKKNLAPAEAQKSH